ncbi:uncharacterized protein LOC134786931 [Penaeus indicus]|uniref:uncharacterized protein LOC134786931 n=1 Tax=Penaeus indicus TaxID=29960 RepID=UPI00300C5610
MCNILASLFGLSQRTSAPKEEEGQRWRRVFPQVVVVNGAATFLAFFSNCGPCIFTACEVQGYALWGAAETLSTWFVRWYFVSLGLLILFTILSCWCKICVLLEDHGRRNSARAQLLLNTLVVCFNYAVGWLPYTLLVGISGSLDGGTFVKGFESLCVNLVDVLQANTMFKNSTSQKYITNLLQIVNITDQYYVLLQV